MVGYTLVRDTRELRKFVIFQTEGVELNKAFFLEAENLQFVSKKHNLLKLELQPF